MSEFQITDTPALESDIADTLATPVTGIPQSTAPPAGMLDVFGQSDWRDDHEKAMDTWRNESFTALDAAVIDPKSYGDERVPSGYTPDEWRKTRVVDDWMRLHTDGEAPPMGLSREFTRGRLAEQVFGGAGAENDDALYGEITKAATGRKQVKDLAAELSTAARTSATVGDLGEKGGTFKNWKAAAMNKPGYSAENEPDYFEAWHQTQRQAKDQLAPYKAELAQVWKAMKAGGAGSPSEVIKSLGADLLLGGGADGEDTVDEFQKKDAGAVAYEAYAKLAEDERPAFLDGLSVLIQQFPKEDRPALLATWGKQFGATVDSMGRGAVSRFTADGMQQWIDQEAANTAGPFAASEEFKAQGKVRTDESLKRRNFMDAVRKMERDEYAPTQFYSDPSKDVFSTRTLEQGFYGSASAVASVAVMATPYIGYATLGLAMEDFAFADLRDNAVRSGASEMDASRFAHENKTLAAVPQLGIEILQNNLALGKLPMANKVLMKLGDSIKNRLLRGVVKAGAVGAAETTVEEIQFLTPYLVQDISAALEADTGISAAEWSNGKDGALDGFWTRQATTFLSMLPLGAAAAAGGLNREARQAAFAKATDEELTAFGGTPEAIAGLRSAQGPASTAAAVDAFMETRDPNTEAAAAAVESQKQKVTSQRQAVADLERLGYAAPTFTQTPEGVFVFDSDGNELGMAQNFAGASRIAAAHTTTLVNMEKDRVDALTTLMEGVKAAVALDPTSETEVNLGEFDPAQATPGMAARFAAQVALKEVAEGGTGKIALSVLGYSVTEMAQGVRHTVNRLFKGASITDAFHETGHGLRRKAHAAGTITRAMEASLLINQDTVYAGRRVRDAQGKQKGTDLRLVPDGITAAMLETGEIPAAMIPAEFDGDGRRYADQILDEGVSEIIEAEVLKLRKGKGRGKLGITRELVQKNLQAMARLNATEAKSWKSFFAAVRGHWGLAMSRAVAMAGAERRGEFDPAVRDAYLDKLLGLDQQTEHDAGVQDEFSRMMAGFDDVDMEEDDIPFSIGKFADHDTDTHVSFAIGAAVLAHNAALRVQPGTLSERLKNEYYKPQTDTILYRPDRFYRVIDAAAWEDAKNLGYFRPNPNNKQDYQSLYAAKGTTAGRYSGNYVVEIDPAKSGEWQEGTAGYHLAVIGSVKLDGAVRVFQKAADGVTVVHDNLNDEAFMASDSISFSIGRSTVTPTAATRSFQGAEGSPSVIGPASFSIGAFHGTPHQVDKFTTDKIGTGEGAQAYGWGLYFAAAEAVGRGYMKAGRSLGIIKDSDGKWWTTDGSQTIAGPFGSSSQAQQIADAPAGNLYRVTLKVEDEELLDWDKPLSEQSEKVRAAFQGWLSEDPEALAAIQNQTGADWYGRWENTARAKNKSEYMLERLGIRGIRYLDGNSRADGEGSYNYVVFDEADIEILEENGTPVDLSAGSFSIGRATQLAKQTEKSAKIAEEDFFKTFWPRMMKLSGQNLKASTRNINEAAKRAVADIGEWVKNNPKFQNYYTEDWKNTRGILDETFPQFTDDLFRGFRLFTGLTSPSTPLDGNLADAVQLINLWIGKGSLLSLTLKKSDKGNRAAGPGPFPLRSNTGATKIFSLHVVESLYRKLGDWEKTVDFLNEPVSVKDLHAFNKEMGYAGSVGGIGNIRRVVMEATGQDEMIPRMFIFGQKVGAYTLNTLGDHRYTTTDIWESRYIRSYFPEMFKTSDGLPVNEDEHTIFQRFASAFNAQFEAQYGVKLENSALQAVRWFYMLAHAKEAGYRYARTDQTISGYTLQAVRNYIGNDSQNRGRGGEGSGEAEQAGSFSLGGAKAAGFEKAKAEGRTFTGKDGKERFELDASQAAFNPSAIKDPAHRNGFKRLGADSPIRWLVPEDMDTPLGNLISFDELFENYPQLAGLKVRLKTLPTGTQGRFARVEINGKVSLEFSNIDLTDRLKAGAALNVLLHETQHVIQDIEGFAQGGSPEQFQDYDEAGLKLENNKYAAAMRALIEEHEAKGGTAKDAMQSEYGKVLSDSLIKIQDALREPARKYRALPGEKEARGVQARQSMTAEARAATPFMDQWGSFSLGRAMPDIENLSPVANRVEAHRLYAEGKLLYGIDEQSEELSLITSMEMLNAYPPDALGYEQPDGPAFSLGGAKDAEYLALAQDPEKNRGKLQALVAMAAKAAGYLVEAWHGSPDFKGDAFNRKYFGRNTGLSRGGFSFTTDKAAAEGYMKGAVDQSQAMVDAANDVMREFQDRIDGGLKWTGPFDEESAPEFRSDMVDDIEDAAGYMLDLAKTMPSDLAGKLRAASKINSTDPTPRLIHVFLKNPTRIDVAGKELLQVQNPADAKSAEAITRDDSGKIIPLSQRFDSTKDSISFSLGPAQVAGILSDNALARITDPRRRTYVMSRIARDFNAMRLQIERITSLSGIRRSKGDLRREAMAREDMAAEEKIAAIHQRFGEIMADEDLVKIKSQPVHSFLSDPTTPLRGRVMSKRQAMKNHPDVFQLHRAGDYDGSDGVSRSVFGGQRMPDQAAQELFDEGLISEPTADAMWEALLSEQKTVAGMKEMLAKATEQIREAKAQAKQEANEWLATQGKDQEVNFSDKEEIRRSLRMLDAILLALPAEIRGKIGGYTQISMIASDDARLAYLKDKLNKADKELEDFLRVEYAKEWEELLKKAAPKTNEAGQRPTGSIAADAYDVFRVAEHAMGMSFAEGEAEADKWDAIADHPDTDPKDVDLARVKAQMIRLTMNWPAADAARREQAVLEGDKIYFGGLRALAIENSRRRERLGKLRDSAVRGTGKTGHRMEREAAKQATATKLGAVKAMAWEFLSFGQVVNVLFGEKSDVARWMNSREIAASNGAHDGFQAKANALESLFDTLSGNRFDGEKLRHRMATDPRIKVQDVLGVDHTFTESQAITFLLMYRQEDGKRHLQGLMDDAGNVVSEWAWDDKSAATIEAGLSSEGRAAMAFLGSSYGEEYGRINDVFRRIWNVSMPRHKMYAPLSVKPVQGKGDTIMDPVSGDSMGAGMTPGSLKNRSFSAIAEPDFKDAFQVYLTHARQMEHFIAYAEFSRDALGIINRRETRNAIEAAGGADAAATLSKWVDYFALGGIHGAAMGGAWTKILGGMLGRLSQAALVGRVSVLCMQSLQLAAASFKMPTGAFLTRFAKLSAGRLQWGDTIQSEYIQRRVQQLPPVVRDMMAGMASGTPNRAKFLAGQAGRTIAGADALFTAGTYAIFYDYHLGLAKKAAIANPEAHAHAEAERFTDQVAQPVRTGARSWLEVANASNPAFRAAWNFSSDPRQKMSLLVYAAMRKDSTGTEKVADVAFTAAKLWIIGGVLSTLVRTVLRDLRNDDDDEIFDERYWSPARLALQVATGPIGGAPFLGDMVEGATYKATGQFMPTGGMLSFFDQAAGLPKKWAGGKVEPIKDLETLTSAGAGLSGTSAAAASAMHLIRDVVGFIENLEGPD